MESNNVVADTVGKISYDIEWSLIDFHLSQGLSVIFDSPCFYTEMVEKGVGLSKKHNVRYKYVECYLNDIKEIQIRLKERTRMISQISRVDSEFAFRERVEASKKPLNLECLVVDSGKPIDSYIEQVILYIKN